MCPVPLTGYRWSSLCQPGAFSSCSSDYLAPSLWGLEVLSGKSLSPLPQEGSELSSSLPFVKPETSPPFVFLLPKFCDLFLFASANFHPLWFLLFSLSLSVKLNYYFLIISVVSWQEVVINMYIQPTILNTRFFHLLFVPRPQPCFPPPRELLHEFPLTSNSQIRRLFLVLILLKYSVVPSAAHSHCLLRPGGHSILFWAS